jgi:hypothetical protein
LASVEAEPLQAHYEALFLSNLQQERWVLGGS